MNRTDLDPGYIGLSRSDTSINAIIWGEDGDFYFYVVTEEQAARLDWWDDSLHQLEDILPDASDEDINMFLLGQEDYDS